MVCIQFYIYWALKRELSKYNTIFYLLSSQEKVRSKLRKGKMNGKKPKIDKKLKMWQFCSRKAPLRAQKHCGLNFRWLHMQHQWKHMSSKKQFTIKKYWPNGRKKDKPTNGSISLGQARQFNSGAVDKINFSLRVQKQFTTPGFEPLTSRSQALPTRLSGPCSCC